MHKRRKSIRLKEYDYSLPGYYFVTICTFEKFKIFGHVECGNMVLNDIGIMVHDEWLNTARVRSNILLDEFVIMPDHIHGIIKIDHSVGASRRDAPTLQSGSIGAVIGQFKSMATKRINKYQNTPKRYVWQRNYYEHIIRNQADLNRAREYIINNPTQWETGCVIPEIHD